MKFSFRSLKKRFRHFLGKEDGALIHENHGSHLITEKSSMRILEAYSMARTNLFYSGNSAEGGMVFGVTSASPSDGKSLTCANLAISFAMSGKRVLLIDCDKFPKLGNIARSSILQLYSSVRSVPSQGDFYWRKCI